MLPLCQKPFLWLSGTISSATRKSIAPAANAKPHGRKEYEIETNVNPSNPPSGSISPVKVA